MQFHCRKKRNRQKQPSFQLYQFEQPMIFKAAVLLKGNYIPNSAVQPLSPCMETNPN